MGKNNGFFPVKIPDIWICEMGNMDFFRRLKKQLNISQPQQLKRECLWLWAKIRKYRNWITVVGILALASTVMNLVSKSSETAAASFLTQQYSTM